MGETRFVGTGETRGYPYLVCKKSISETIALEAIPTDKSQIDNTVHSNQSRHSSLY